MSIPRLYAHVVWRGLARAVTFSIFVGACGSGSGDASGDEPRAGDAGGAPTGGTGGGARADAGRGGGQGGERTQPDGAASPADGGDDAGQTPSPSDGPPPPADAAPTAPASGDDALPACKRSVHVGSSGELATAI